MATWSTLFVQCCCDTCLKEKERRERKREREKERKEERTRERQKDRKTERHKDRKTERHKDIKTERQNKTEQAQRAGGHKKKPVMFARLHVYTCLNSDFLYKLQLIIKKIHVCNSFQQKSPHASMINYVA